MELQLNLALLTATEREQLPINGMQALPTHTRMERQFRDRHHQPLHRQQLLLTQFTITASFLSRRAEVVP